MKKKILSILLAALMLVSLLPTVAFAAAEPIGDSGVTWELSEGNTVLTLGGTGAMPDFTEIDFSTFDIPWYSAKDTITTVKVGSGITRIGDNAFFSCNNIENLYIEDLESWCKIEIAGADSYPFRRMEGNHNLYVNGNPVTDLVIPDTVTEIKNYAFLSFDHLKSVTIPSSVTSIGYRAFVNCVGLTGITIPTSVTSIGDGAFGYCEGLTSITIPAGVTSIEPRVFACCTALTSATISSGVTSIGDGAFANCPKLASVTIPSSVTEIGTNVFGSYDSDYDGCVSLTTVTVKATTPPTLSGSVFPTSNAGFKVYVPYGTLTDYQNATRWKLPTLKARLAEAYVVDDKPTTHGTVAMSKDCFPSDTYTAANETVNVTVTPDEGYQLKSLKYNDGEDHDITSAKSFTMPLKNVTVTAEFEEAPTYAITNGTAQDAHGSISFDKTTAAEGETVTVTVNPATGYQLKSLTVAPTGFVDLGIKDAEGKPLYWKETNLGASNPQDPGDYYMWGATALMYSAVDRSKTSDAFTIVTENPYGENYKHTWDASLGFTWNNLPFTDGVFNNVSNKNAFTKYTTIDTYAKSGTPDNITTLQPEDDAATAKNANWRMPTKDELAALAANCVLVWTDNYNSTGNAGYIVYKAKNDADKGKANMNGTWKKWNGTSYTDDSAATGTYSISDAHIFLPAAGYGNDTTLTGKNTVGAYWSSNLNNTYNQFAGAVNFTNSLFNIAYNYSRSYGFSIRPVMSFSGITPAKQTGGTYQFKMPSYPVRVTAEFEEVKTLPYSFDFESDFIAAGWTNIDADKDGYDWITGTNKYKDDEGKEWGVGGSRCAISQSYDNDVGAFDADNWLFSPAITIPAGGATVSWYEQSQDASYPDFYEVYVSETNTSTDTSKMTKIFSDFAANPWKQRSVELEAAEYAGKTVYIAFRHLCYDYYMLEIDDFAAEAVAPAHTHAFTYTANNGKITATCVDGCDDGYDINHLTLTLTAPASLVYDGNAKAFTFADGEAAAWEAAGLELPTIYYQIKQSGQSTYLPLFGTLKFVGNYMAQITVDGKDAQVYFTIDKATPYIKTTPAPNDIEYGKKLSDSTLFGGYVQISSTDSSEVGGLFEWTNPDTVPGIDDSETTEYDVTFTPADTNNYNTVSCKVKIKVTHTHNPVKVTGQAATETAAGWSDYYECKDSTDACHKYFEDATCKVEITDLNAWKAQGGKGYIAPLVHSITPVNGKNATDTEAGYKPYYECKNCNKYYEDATGLIEIPDIDAWKSQTGKGYIPSGNEINAAKTAAKAALDSENAKDALLDETALTNGKSAIDSAETLADIENAKNAAVTAIQQAQATELADAKTSAKSALDTEEAKDLLTDKTALTNGKDSIDGATTKVAVEAAKNAAVTAIQQAQATELANAKTNAKSALNTEEAKDLLTDKTALTNGKNSIDGATTKVAVEAAKNAAITAIQEAQATELANAKDAAKSALDTEEAKDSLTDKTALTNGKNSIDGATTKAAVEAAKNAAITAIQEAQATEHKDPKSPQTGDTSNMTLWVMLLALSSMGLCACLVLGKKRKKEQ